MADTKFSRYPIDAYIINMNTGTRIELDLLPESIDDSYTANYNSTPILGRSTPIIGYSEGGPRSISFSVKLHDDVISEAGMDIVDKVNILKALSYPSYENDRVISPKCYVRIGSMISMTGVCNNVGVSWEPPYSPTKKGRVSYLQAEVSLSFDEVQPIPQSASQIENDEVANRPRN